MSQVIVVGAGNWGKNLVRNFHQLGALAGVAEANPDLLAQVRAQYPEVPTYADFDSALAADASALVIATPAFTHHKLALQALEAGKDVFVEKPMTMRTEEARQLAEYADQHQRVLMVGHLLLYQEAIAWMQDYLASGEAGEVLHVATQRLKLGKVRAEENVWWSFAPHDISVVLALLGNPPLESVKAQGQAILQPSIADHVHVDLNFAGGKSAHIHCSWQWPEIQRSTVVVAQRQMLVYNEVTQTVTIYDKGVNPDLSHYDRGDREVKFADPAPLARECAHFLQCLQTREQPRSNGWNGVAVVEILEKAQEALNHG